MSCQLLSTGYSISNALMRNEKCIRRREMITSVSYLNIRIDVQLDPTVESKRFLKKSHHHA